MSLFNKAKETVVEWAVLSTIAIIGILALILWKSVPASFWETILNAVEKKVLWALIGLLFIAVLGEAVYILQNYLRARTILRHYGGVLWNSNSDLFCPKDETPLFLSGKTINEENYEETIEIFQCPKCDSDYILKDSDGMSIPLDKAKKNFLVQQSLKVKGSIQSPLIEESFDETMLTILKAFGGTTSANLTLEQFTGLLNNGTKPARINYSLDILNKRGYLSIVTIYSAKHPHYELTPKGREYLVKNNYV